MTTVTLTNQLVGAQPTPQQLTDYANALLVINNYAYSITNQQLPVLNYPPTNYANFVSQFAPAKQHALDWSTNIFVSMVQLPSTIKNQAANLFSLEQTMIEAYLNILIADPSNAQAKSGLASALSTVQQVIQNQVTAIENIESELATFTTNIANDAKILTQISADALTDAGADQATINTLLANIETLKSEISAAQTLLTVSEIGMGLSIFVGLIGAVCCLIPGAQGVGVGLIVVGVAGEAASIAGTVIESEKIKALQGEITSDQTQISGLNQDIIQLNAVSSQFNDLYNANLQAQAALSTIKSMWTNLDSAIEAVSAELTTVAQDVTSTQYRQALSDFKDAEQNWQAVVDFADALAGINYSWQDSTGTWHVYGTQNPSADASQVNQIAAA